MIFDAGLSDADEAADDVEPFTYKLRGLWLDGAAKLLTLDTGATLTLSNNLTLAIWFNAKNASGTLFSKSYASYATADAPKFF
ncbi:MAG: hypothetical protein V2I33_25005 [Kangiellaceae bacterium]|nr:hypothetical protein [Kangiellaceae bacterium]